MTFQITVGEASVAQVTELAAWPFPPRDLFPGVDGERAVRDAAGLGPGYADTATGELVLAIHSYVVRLGDTTVVVDAGNGNQKERPNLLPHHRFDTDFLDRFVGTGTALHDVDVVVSTHLHPDHCGWNTRLDGDRWRPTFPRATYLFGRAELASLQALAAKSPADGVPADLVRAYDDSVRPVLETGRWEAADDGHVLAEHGDTVLVLRAAPGHTAGHVVAEIRSRDGGAVICGDVVHHPIQQCCPELSQAGDADPALARRTRDDLLDRCARDGLLLLPAHFPADRPFAVAREGGRFRLAPVERP
ncbi:MBL fold metallo-hydrolase [Actinomadura syzygii]|uniref:MBL fold metallo-hydrolase n=1 Tax=Actinomadura syzygii TaxID=1427538 RepID=A0A5D0TSC1_9ACTN|nr:MBL fold metallo-hydrolase [Actinomadura syzygii]TYC08664.1 MBL fold metallo-hydrolase [Actinomadura syzygii]